MTETTTATVSPWPIAEATLASCPHLAWLWQDGPARPPTEAELKAYADRRDDPDDILCDAGEIASRLLREWQAESATPAEPQHCSCAACTPVLLPGIGELDEGQQEALDRFNRAFEADPDGDSDRANGTAVLPAVDAAQTDLMQAVEPDCGERP